MSITDSGSGLIGGSQSSVLANRVLVTQASKLSGTLDSTKEYFIDGVVDMGTQQIEVPAGGLNLKGYNFDVSKLISSEDNYTMFTSPVGGSGNVLGQGYAIEVTGTSSQVYDLVSDTGFEAFEFSQVNYNDCTSLGTIDNYRQGFETGTGRFGGKPELTLAGTWIGGYFIESSIVRSLVDGAYRLFKAGAGFSMASRFRSNQNIDLPASASYTDFTPAQFTNPSTVQLDGMIISRDGVFNSSDSNILPNISHGDLPSSWKGNVGIPNTFEGGVSTVTVEAATTVSLVDTWYALAGTWSPTSLQHFDSPSNGQLRHLGDNPKEYKITSSLVIAGTSGHDISVRLGVWDDSASSFTNGIEQRRQINALAGSRDVAFFTIIGNTELDKNDYIFLEILNNTSGTNVTVELDSFFLIEGR